MRLKKLSIVLLFALMLVLPVVLAQNSTATEQACTQIKSKITTIINLLTFVAGGVAVIAAIIIGIMFMNAGDPSEKDKLGAKLKALIIGIVIVALANPIVQLLFGAIMDCATVAAG